MTAWVCTLLAVAAVGQDLETWPQFRGEGARGWARESRAPTTFDIDTGTNVRLRVEVPGLGHSSPIVWGDRIYLTTAEGEDEAELRVGLYGAGDPVEGEGEQAFSVLCYDRASGDLLWETLVWQGVPEIKRHTKASHVNSTPATDGEHIVAFFGSEGLYCLDVEGGVLWEKDFGTLDCGAPGMREYQWGFASSPILYDGIVLVQCDVHDQSFLAALRVEDGEEVWRSLRDEDPCWATPTVGIGRDGLQVVVNGYRHIGGYDFETGAELWRTSNGGDVPVPTPVFAHGLVFLTSAHGRNAPIFAVDPRTAEGEFPLESNASSEGLVWAEMRRGNYMQTPLIVGDVLYCCADNGVLSRFDAKTGALHDRVRLGDGSTGFSASAVAAGDRVYFTSEQGDVIVVAAGVGGEVLARNSLEEICMATPAIVGDDLIFRTRAHLVVVGTESGVR